MKNKILKGLTVYAAIFAIIFILRLIYGFASHPQLNRSYVGSQNGFTFSTRNYASAKKFYKKQLNLAGNISKVTVDQKYEKVADLASRTGNFTKDEKRSRDIIKQYNALIQYEGRTGLKGKRGLNLAIGVKPDRFDEMVRDMSKIGTIVSSSIKKTDKTNEYKDLNAKKKSLTKIRNSLINLKRRNGKIEEYIRLDNRILEIEKELQGLGVKLGEYDAENEFCTVKFSLKEGKKASGISFVYRIKIAIEWSFFFYLAATFLAILGMISTLIGFIVIEKTKLIQKIYEKSREE
jgi:hypothetical protein